MDLKRVPLREGKHIKARYAMVLSSVGMVFLICAGLMLTPLFILPVHPTEVKHAAAFLLPSGCLLALGGLLRRVFRPGHITLSVQEGGVVVLISWVFVIVASASPFMPILKLPFSRALFESVSGWTTTGLSVVDVTQAGPMILLWRSIIQLAGGAGLAIIMMSAIVGPTGIGISTAEGRSDQLVPHVRQSARLVLTIYIGYAGIGTAAYWLVGMSPLDALNHSFAAVSTGGFSTHPESIGYWDSPAIEAVTLALMLLGNLSFVTAWFLWSGRFRAVMRNGEVRLLTVLIPLSTTALFVLTCHELYPQLGRSFRVALFETVSAITTTGFSTVSYTNWNSFGIFMLVVMMLIGGGTCSTAGGIKQFRIYTLWKLIFWEIKRHTMPLTAVLERPIWEGNHHVFIDDARVRQITVFFFLYMLIYALGVLLMCACGYSLSDSLFEFASAIGTVGLSVGVTSAKMSDAALWSETLAMFLGRLEFIIVIVSLIKLGKDARLMTARSKEIKIKNEERLNKAGPSNTQR